MTDSNPDPTDFDDQQLLRYSRQIMLPQFGIESQQKLANSHIVMIGVGGLGSPAALYLTAAGIGKLTLIDHDKVELSNLQRQIIHQTQCIGEKKVTSACRQLQRLNPHTQLETIDQKLDSAELNTLLSNSRNPVDCVLDGTDNFAARFTINASCVATGTPLVSAAAIRMEGQISVFDFRHNDSACYACLYPDVGTEETRCSENGILAPVVGIMGCMQALEAIKLITETGETLKGKLLCFDAMHTQWRSINFSKDPECPICSQARTV